MLSNYLIINPITSNAQKMVMYTLKNLQQMLRDSQRELKTALHGTKPCEPVLTSETYDQSPS